ncbi:TIGR01777 family oxidoreductase [uncultured Mucilaginibacter sp.]|uniref:TIGR01777 family oxidoreductase n=1 Tax=uncultured Mucilaginibacter sp. TaxID=797541 RepID=UPI0025D2FFD7|nr:TIGR01777 family oxidoreductase [uncultured Mucilaginibacter sp.]
MKKYNKIVLAGGNGYLGTVLANFYRHEANQVIILSRKPAASNENIKTVFWDGQNEGDWTKVLDNADMLINLCGKNVNCRYTEKNKKEIIASRVVPTALLGKVIGKLSHPPKLWINITSATIYRHAEDCAQDDYTGQIGSGFSVDVCKQWEKTFFDTVTPATRKIALRMGIVLGASDGVFPRLHNLVKFGLGGKQGNGKQYVSWIHERDVAGITQFLLEHNELDGVINCTAPQAIQNSDLMLSIRKSCRSLIGLPAPGWLLEIGALLIGTETELILKSRWVTPKRLLDAGYTFKYVTAPQAVDKIISSQ